MSDVLQALAEGLDALKKEDEKTGRTIRLIWEDEEIELCYPERDEAQKAWVVLKDFIKKGYAKYGGRGIA